MARYRNRTTQQYRECVRRFVRRTKIALNNRGYYPRKGSYTDSVLLAIFSKSIRVSESICSLLEAGFDEEAFGMTRTLLDLLFNIRYIVNRDTENRAKLFYNFFSRNTVHWEYVVSEFYAPGAITLPPLNPKISDLAKTYKDPHRWAGPGMTAQKIAMEPDTDELDSSGHEITFKFQYEVLFRWTSHFIHPSVIALYSHLIEPGSERFKVHAHKDLDMNFEEMALDNIVASLGQITTQFFRGMRDDDKSHLGTYAFRLLEALAKR